MCLVSSFNDLSRMCLLITAHIISYHITMASFHCVNERVFVTLSEFILCLHTMLGGTSLLQSKANLGWQNRLVNTELFPPQIYVSIYVCMYPTSFHKFLHVLIHWTALILYVHHLMCHFNHFFWLYHWLYSAVCLCLCEYDCIFPLVVPACISLSSLTLVCWSCIR